MTELRGPIEIAARGGVSVPVTLQDQITDMLDLLFLEEKVMNLTLAVDTDKDSRFVTLTSGHTLTTANSQNHILEIAASNGRFTQNVIIAVVGDIVETDRQVGDVFTTSDALVQTGNPNMAQDAATAVAIDGSSTPVIFRVKPLPSQRGDITRTMMASTSSNASDLTTFGGAPGLTLGLTLRYKRQDGTYKNIFNYKNNFDLAIHGFDTERYDPKGGNTVNGFGGRVTYAGQSKHGAAIRAEGARTEELQIVINELMDNTATGNISVVFIGEGSELQED